MKFLYNEKWAKKSDDAVEEHTSLAYDKADGTHVDARKSTKYFAPDGNSYTCTGTTETRVTYLVRTAVKEETD